MHSIDRSTDVGLRCIILDAFYERSEQIKDPEFIKNKYSCFVEEYIYNYLLMKF